MRTHSILTIGVLLLIPMVCAKAGVDASSGAESLSFLFTAAKHYEPLAWMRGADRFPDAAHIVFHRSEGERLLVPDFAESADPAVSYDGHRVLFAGKAKPEDRWQIWETSSTGEAPHRITNCSEDCVRPFYLPEDRIVYARKTAGRFVIETVSLTSGKPLVLTYGAANFLPSDVLRDGRILFESAYPLGSEKNPEIYTVYSDGSGIESYRCDHRGARHSGRQLSSGDIVFASDRGLGRFTSARAEEVPMPATAGEYAGEIAETPAGDWLIPWRPNPQSRFQIMLRSTAAGLRAATRVPDANAVQPVILGEHTTPKIHPSGLHDWNNANLLCLNAYTSKYQFSAGSIHSVRIYTRDDAGNPRLLGNAPVESDGSFFVQVPTEQPLEIELLNAAGKSLKRESGFFWMRRGEQRACVGCHAGPETAPENRVPMILLKSTTPVDVTRARVKRACGGH